MTQITTATGTMSGSEKAAILMLALGETHAGKLMQMMDDDEIRLLSQQMARLGTISAGAVESLLIDFGERISSTGALVGTYESTERLLLRILEPERARQIMEEIRGPSGRTMWDKLGNVNEAVLANYLKNEYPQTVAVVLSKVKPAHGARVLSLLPENFALDVLTRMLRMETVQKEVLEQVERTLRSEFMTNLAQTQRSDVHELVAEIFNNFDRGTEARFMTALEELNQTSAQRIKELMFTFEDLVRLDAGGMQVLLRQVAKEQLQTALKGASEALKELFFKNMSQRAGKMLQEDIAAMGPVRLRDVDAAQSAIVATAKALAEAGEIVMGGRDGAEEMVY
ncbi:MAG: flagellar motor switch protein FliG [Rhodospirillales bacterium]|nr:flagellar motor switch protein FliG [Rhodospirillales bacterium]